MVKNLPANAEVAGLIPGSERSPGGGNGNPLQYSSLGNPTDRGTWQAVVHGVVKSQTQWGIMHSHDILLRSTQFISWSMVNTEDMFITCPFTGFCCFVILSAETHLTCVLISILKPVALWALGPTAEVGSGLSFCGSTRQLSLKAQSLFSSADPTC